MAEDTAERTLASKGANEDTSEVKGTARDGLRSWAVATAGRFYGPGFRYHEEFSQVHRAGRNPRTSASAQEDRAVRWGGSDAAPEVGVRAGGCDPAHGGGNLCPRPGAPSVVGVPARPRLRAIPAGFLASWCGPTR